MKVFTVKGKLIRACCALLASLVMCNTFILTASAYTFETGYTLEFDADGACVLPDSYFKDNPNKEKVCEDIWKMLKKEGCTDIMAAAFCANIAAECNFDPCASEFIIDDDNGRGIMMFTPYPSNQFNVGVHADIAKYAASKKDHTHGEGTDCSYHHAAGEDGDFTWQHCIPCQIEFYFQDPNYGGKHLYNGYGTNVVAVPEGVVTGVDLCKYDFLAACDNDLDKALKLATEDFCFCCEVPSITGSHIGARVKNAKMIYEKFKGTEADANNNIDEDIDDLGVTGGFMSEDEFVPVHCLTEAVIALQGSLPSETDRVNVNIWRQDIEDTKEIHKYDTIRSVVAVAGTILCVYSLILYLAYQFDSVNNFVDIELLSILSAGHLRVSPDEKASNTGGSGATKAVTHTQMIKVTLLGSFIGALIVSGAMYSVILTIIDFVLRIIA